MRCVRGFGLGMVAFACVVLALQSGCTKIPDPWPERPGPRVVTSFAPVHCFTLNVAGDDAVVKSVMSDRGPHHFTSTPRDMKILDRANVFFINGLQLDNGIAAKMLKGGRNRALKPVETAAAIPEKELREGVCTCGHEHGDDDEHDHDHGKFDPHVWLGIPEAIHMVESIRDELKRIDPEHAAGYESRANSYIEKLKALADEGRALLKDKKERKLVSFHDSLFYFARTFGLEIIDSIEVTAGVETGGVHLQKLVKACQENRVRIITVEPQYDRTTAAKTLRENLKAKGVPAEFVEIDPIETAKAADLADPGYYEKVMRQNLKNLAEKLQ